MVVWYVALVVAVYFVSITIAWLINRRELKRVFGEAPFNWHIYGWVYTYTPYLKQRQKERTNV